MQHPRWQAGALSTGLIAEEFPGGFHPMAPMRETANVLAAVDAEPGGAPLSLAECGVGGNGAGLEDHIMDGDYVVCEQTQVANAGDIVVALVRNEEATLKRFYREGSGKVRLQPANSEMGPIIEAASDVKIQGRVIGVLRKY